MHRNSRNTLANAPVTCSLTSGCFFFFFFIKEKILVRNLVSTTRRVESNIVYVAAQLWAPGASYPTPNPNGLPLNMLLLISSSKSHSWHFCTVWLHSGAMKCLSQWRKKVSEKQDDHTRKRVEAEHSVRQGSENDTVLSDHMLREK